MWIYAAIPGKEKRKLSSLSKKTSIEEVRTIIADLCDASTDRIRLFYGGKQLVDEHTIHEYGVKVNETLLVVIQPASAAQLASTPSSGAKNKDEGGASSNDSGEGSSLDTSSSECQEEDYEGNSLYKVGDLVDGRSGGSWWEAVVVRVTKKSAGHGTTGGSAQYAVGSSEPVLHEDLILYHLEFPEFKDDGVVTVCTRDLRPRAHQTMSFDLVSPGDHLMVNYNHNDPSSLRGSFFDAVVTGIGKGRGRHRFIICTVFVGADLIGLEDCKISLVEELFRIPKPSDISRFRDQSIELPPTRKGPPLCVKCQDDKAVESCSECGCQVCLSKSSPNLSLLCDECNTAWHATCLSPPVDVNSLSGEWYCPNCKVDDSKVVKAGEKLKETKRTAKKEEGAKSTRDWGKGMACQARSEKCTIVPVHHIGPIPGVEVGSCWKYRLQVSGAGIHRPHVAGMHGKEAECAYSIVLSGGFPNDKDDGETFTYTGCGGCDLSGNRRTGKRNSDQKLEKLNLALARNCNAAVDKVNGATAPKGEWKKGRPVRVVRSAKAPNKKYAPPEGNRYDGIYKVVRYWPEKNTEGFKMWRYQLKRDDLIPAPWTKQGKARIKELGLTIQFPEGFDNSAKSEPTSKKDKSGKGSKRKLADAPDTPQSPAKKPKVVPFKVDAKLRQLISADTLNKKSWEEVLGSAKNGRDSFMATTEEAFKCICCQDVLFKPVTLPCSHTFCKPCLDLSFQATQRTSCMTCRADFEEGGSFSINKELRAVLNHIYVGYEAGR